MDANTIYMMSGIEYTYDELCDAVRAEAATLPPDRRETGHQRPRLHTEAVHVGVIEIVDDEDD